MAINWIDLINGEALLDWRNKVNTFNNSVVAETNNLSGSINSTNTQVATNTTNIGSNTSNIATNTSAISLHEASINILDTKTTDLEALTTDYHFSKVAGASTTTNTYSPLNSLLVTAAQGTVYEVKFSMTFNYNTTTRSAYFRFTVDGGISWNEVRKEAKDVTDNNAVFYAFPITHIPGDNIDLQVEYRTESNGNVLKVSFIDVVAERKL